MHGGSKPDSLWRRRGHRTWCRDLDRERRRGFYHRKHDQKQRGVLWRRRRDRIGIKIRVKQCRRSACWQKPEADQRDEKYYSWFFFVDQWILGSSFIFPATLLLWLRVRKGPLRTGIPTYDARQVAAQAVAPPPHIRSSFGQRWEPVVFTASHYRCGCWFF
jgi:hypothetical protein